MRSLPSDPDRDIPNSSGGSVRELTHYERDACDCGGMEARRSYAPAFHHIHHLGLTVRDVDASAAWYEDVLGFERVGSFEAPGGERRKVFLRHVGLQTRLGLTEHRAGSQDGFDELRIGLDHLAFAVDSRRDLDAWTERLQAAGVTHSPVASSNSIPGAAVLVFRDPDNIQLELFFDPSD
jgi:glyoxylase I family protein